MGKKQLQKRSISPFLSNFSLTRIPGHIFTMRVSLLLLVLIHHHILISSSSSSSFGSSVVAGDFNLPLKNDPESSRERSSIRLHFSRYSGSKNIDYDDEKRLVPTGANPLHNRW